MRRTKEESEGAGLPDIPGGLSIQDMAQLVSGWTPDELARMRQTVLDAACGIVLGAPAKRRGVAGLTDEYICEYEVPGLGMVHIYKKPPSEALLNMLVVQNLGRPGYRSAERVDPVIRVFTAVPGFEEAQMPVADIPSFGLDPATLEDL